MRENRQSGSEGGGTETNRFSLPLSGALSTNRWAPGPVENPGIFRCVCRCPSYPSSSFINSARRSSMAFKRVPSFRVSVLRSANSLRRFFWCNWSSPLLARARDSTSCRNSRYQGLPWMLLSRNCSLPARIPAMISGCVKPNSFRADLSLRVAPFCDQINLLSSIAHHPFCRFPGHTGSSLAQTQLPGLPWVPRMFMMNPFHQSLPASAT